MTTLKPVAQYMERLPLRTSASRPRSASTFLALAASIAAPTPWTKWRWKLCSLLKPERAGRILGDAINNRFNPKGH
jgi:hypothetical protein